MKPWIEKKEILDVSWLWLQSLSSLFCLGNTYFIDLLLLFVSRPKNLIFGFRVNTSKLISLLRIEDKTSDAGSQYRCGRVGRGAHTPSPPHTNIHKKYLKISFFHFSNWSPRIDRPTDRRTKPLIIELLVRNEKKNKKQHGYRLFEKNGNLVDAIERVVKGHSTTRACWRVVYRWCRDCVCPFDCSHSLSCLTSASDKRDIRLLILSPIFVFSFLVISYETQLCTVQSVVAQSVFVEKYLW